MLSDYKPNMNLFCIAVFFFGVFMGRTVFRKDGVERATSTQGAPELPVELPENYSIINPPQPLDPPYRELWTNGIVTYRTDEPSQNGNALYRIMAEGESDTIRVSTLSMSAIWRIYRTGEVYRNDVRLLDAMAEGE